MSKGRKTAAELMAELKDDSAFCQRQVEAEQERLGREQEIRRSLEPLLNELGAIGIGGSSLQAIVQRFAPLSSDAIEVLLSGLSKQDNARAKEAIVRALAAAKESFDGRPLAACFEETDDDGLKWAILNTIAVIGPHSIDGWLAAIRDTPSGETLRKLSIVE